MRAQGGVLTSALRCAPVVACFRMQTIMQELQDEHQCRGGAPPTIAYAVSLARDRAREAAVRQQEELNEKQGHGGASGSSTSVNASARANEQEQLDAKVRAARENESREARAARMAAAFERRFANQQGQDKK